MNSTFAIILIVLVVVAAAALIYYYRRRRSRDLRSRFGPELARRAKRVSKFAIRGIPESEKQRFADAWQAEQARFVDQPEQAVTAAHRLVSELMRARGYPASEEFEQNADDLSVDHPYVVEHYRTACLIAARRENGQANTEDLRAAMIHYRQLFDELLGKSIQTEVTQ